VFQTNIMKKTVILSVFIISAFFSVAQSKNMKIIENDSTLIIKMENINFNIHFKYSIDILEKLGPIFKSTLLKNTDAEYKQLIVKNIKTQLERYPTSILEFLPTTFYITDQIYNSTIKSSTYTGMYLEHTIYLNCINLSHLKETFHHEIFHNFLAYLDYDELNINVQAIQAETKVNINSLYDTGYVSSYAVTNTGEDLAELFTTLMINKNSDYPSLTIFNYIAKNPNSILANKVKYLIETLQENFSDDFNYKLFENNLNIQ